MLQPDRQRLEHIRDYCIEIKKTITRYGESFGAFDSDADYQRSVSFCILQIGELSGRVFRLNSERRQQTVSSGDPSKGCGIWWRTAMAA